MTTSKPRSLISSRAFFLLEGQGRQVAEHGSQKLGQSGETRYGQDIIDELTV